MYSVTCRRPLILPTSPTSLRSVTELLVQQARLRERVGVVVLRGPLVAVGLVRRTTRGHPQELTDRDPAVDAEPPDHEQLHRPVAAEPDVPGAGRDVDAEPESAEARPTVEHRHDSGSASTSRPAPGTSGSAATGRWS